MNHHRPRSLVNRDDGAPSATAPSGSFDDYHLYLPAAQAIAATDVGIARIDVSRVVINAQRGVAAVLAHRELIATVPGVSIDQVEALLHIGQALAYAAGQVDIVTTPNEIRALLSQAHQIRTKLLANADVLALAGSVPKAAVAKIHKGRGPIDTARDCVALAGLFRTHADAIGVRTTVTAEDIQVADQIGSKLLGALRPAAMKHELPKELVAAADARNRLWTLFEQTWEAHVWRAGAWLFGRAVERHVPLLNTRTRRKPAGKVAAPAPTPAPPAAVPTMPTTTAAAPPTQTAA